MYSAEKEDPVAQPRDFFALLPTFKSSNPPNFEVGLFHRHQRGMAARPNARVL